MRAVVIGLVGAVLALSGAWAEPLSGKYEGKTPRGKLFVTVKKLSGNQYKVDLETWGRGDSPCIGGWGVSGTLRGKILDEAPPGPDFDAGFCPLKITLDGKTVRVVETGLSCYARGAMCSFNGIVGKVK